MSSSYYNRNEERFGRDSRGEERRYSRDNRHEERRYSRDNDKFSRGDRFGDKRDRDNSNEKPTLDRLFIVCGKQHNSDDLRKAFKEYGTIEDIYVVKDKSTGENRGIAYIQYSKMSEACLAIESLNGQKVAEGDSGPKLKVIMAQPRSGTRSTRDVEEEKALNRLFVLIPKEMEEEELRDSFAEFGDIDYIQIVKDRNTGEKKGYGYITYNRAYEAAKALEGADRNFKAVIAEPRSSKMKRQSDGGLRGSSFDFGFSGGRGSGGGGGGGAEMFSSKVRVPSVTFDERMFGSAIGNRLQVNCAFNVTGEQLARLFDLIPGMELCDLKKDFSTGESKGVAIVVFNSVGSATYAKEKLNGFEYPPGFKLSVRYAPDGQGDLVGNSFDIGSSYGGFSSALGGGEASYCNVELPPVQPLVKTENVAERLFIVSQPPPPPSTVLYDIFCRWGDLIDVYMLKGKNFGYAKFANREGADKAMQALNGAEVCGSRLKVLTAEPPRKMRKVQGEEEEDEEHD